MQVRRFAPSEQGCGSALLIRYRLILGRILLVDEEKCLGIGRVGDLWHRAGRVDRAWVFASFRPVRMPGVERRVEIGFEILQGQHGIPFRGPAAPQWVSITPVGEGDVAGRCRDIGIHGSQENAVSIEGDGVGCPVEAIFMDAVVGHKR